MKARAVKVCAKTGIRSSPGSKNLCVRVDLQKTATEKGNLDRSHRFL